MELRDVTIGHIALLLCSIIFSKYNSIQKGCIVIIFISARYL